MDENCLIQVYKHPLLGSEDLAIIFEAHKKVVFSKGDFLLKEGQVANEYFIVASGLIRSYVNDYSGNDITINFFTKNDIVIEVSSLFQRIPSAENIQTLTDCVCWKINYDVFQNFFHSNEGFREWGRGWLSNSLFKHKQRSVSMITKSSKERYLELVKYNPEILLNAPLKYIATFLGITDTSLSRIRKETAKL